MWITDCILLKRNDMWLACGSYQAMPRCNTFCLAIF